MSVKVITYVWEHSKAKSNNRLMLLAIADSANDVGDAYPGVDRLATKCNVSLRCAQDSIRELERTGELKVFENAGTKTQSGWTNLYRVVMSDIKQSEVRMPNGDIAIARSKTEKKSRSFPKEVQTVAPLSIDDTKSKEVQTVASHEVQLDSSHEVQTVAPKPSEHPSVQPSDNTNTSAAVATVPAAQPIKEDVVIAAETHIAKAKPRNLLMDAVCTAFAIQPGGYAQLLIKQLTGDKSSKGKRLEYLINNPPMTQEEILACRDWYADDPRYEDKGALPQTAETIYERVLEFRAQPNYHKYIQAVIDFQEKKAADPEPDDFEENEDLPPDPEQAAKVNAILDRLAKGESIHDLISA